jgi:hypothetical protein
MKRKLGLLIATGMIACFSTKAQVQYIPYAAHRYAVTVAGGATALFGDLDKTKIKPALRLNLDYNITPYISTGLEGQIGGLGATGSGAFKGFETKNNYMAANFNIRCGIGQFTDKRVTGAKKAFGGIYGGIGIGFIKSNVSGLSTKFRNGTKITDSKIDEMELVIPVNAGWNIELPQMKWIHDMVLNFNLQYNFVQGEYIDGYNFSKQKESHNDGYMLFSIGLRHNFGKFR